MPIRMIRMAAALALLVAGAADAQTRALTAADYARAERFLGYNTNRLVLHVAAQPTWVGDERFWYRTTTENGTEFFLVDAATGTRSAAFDQAKVAAALSTAARASLRPTVFRSTSSNSAATASRCPSMRAEASGPAMWAGRAAKAENARRGRRRSPRLTENERPSSATTTSGFATPRPARRHS